MKNFRYVVLTKGLRYLLYCLVRLYSRTFRLTVENEAAWLAHYREGGKVILCTWHQQFFAAMRPFRAYAPFNPCLMISKSRDGDVISYVAKRHGWHTVRGSSSRSGREALQEMVARVNRTRLAAHIADGPKGPAGVVKAGVVRLAHATGAIVVPFSTFADRAWFFRSWDSFMIPKPFARVRLRFEPAVRFPPLAGDEDFERQRAALESVMRPSLISA